MPNSEDIGWPGRGSGPGGSTGSFIWTMRSPAVFGGGGGAGGATAGWVVSTAAVTAAARGIDLGAARSGPGVSGTGAVKRGVRSGVGSA